MSRTALVVAAAALVGGLILAYGNHFDNGFHFDDSHTIVQNAWIRDLSNVREFFTNPETLSTLPTNRQYRPLVTVSLAVDYRLAEGLDPFWFHLSTFVWYIAQLALLFLFFRRTFRHVRPAGSFNGLSLFAVGWYGFHTANAETINYVISRSDTLSTMAVVSTLAVYALAPGRMRYLLIIPAVLGGLVKPTAAMAAPILVVYVWLIEKRGRADDYLRDRQAVALSGAVWAACVGTLWFVRVMTLNEFGVLRAGHRDPVPLRDHTTTRDRTLCR